MALPGGRGLVFVVVVFAAVLVAAIVLTAAPAFLTPSTVARDSNRGARTSDRRAPDTGPLTELRVPFAESHQHVPMVCCPGSHGETAASRRP